MMHKVRSYLGKKSEEGTTYISDVPEKSDGSVDHTGCPHDEKH